MNALLETAHGTARSAEADAFRGAMRHLPSGVSIITVGIGEERSGLTATSVASLSVDPPTLVVSVNQRASTFQALQRHGHFGVNVLAPRHQALAERFAGRGGVRGAARYAGAEWLTLKTGAPLLADALVAFDCEVEELIRRHSHAIVIGRVRALHAPGGPEALVYWRGEYGIVRAP